MFFDEYREIDEQVEEPASETDDLNDSIDLDAMLTEYSEKSEGVSELDQMLNGFETEEYASEAEESLSESGDDLAAMLDELNDDRPSISKDEFDFALDNFSAEELGQLRESLADGRIRVTDTPDDRGTDDGTDRTAKTLGRRR